MGQIYSTDRRVVVTGIGAVSPLGLSFTETWNHLLDGKSGIDRITLFDTEACPVKIAGEVKNFNFEGSVGPFHPKPGLEVSQITNKKEAKKMGRFIQLCLAATFEAYGDSGLDACRNKMDPNRMGANIGVGLGGLPEIENVHNDLLNKGYRRITPFFIPQVIANLASGHISIQLDLRGPNVCNVTACSSSAHSIGESFHMIKRGDAEVMVTGGAEGVISPLSVGGFASMKALSMRNDEPQKASRPFDKQRDGFVIGEGACTLILEEYSHAKSRGAQIYGEVLGYGLSGDAHHMTLPAPEGEGGYRAMEMALKCASIEYSRVGYINAHGTSTPAGDAEEAGAIRKLFPNGPEHLNVSSTKSMTGHLLGAAGALETAFSILAIQQGKIPPTINLENLDPKCVETGLNFTPNQTQEKKFDYALSNSFGFGGTNACLVVGKV